MRRLWQKSHRFSSALGPVALICGAMLPALPAQARLDITIDKSAQRMIVALDELPVFDWPVSTGVSSYDTPSGSYQPFRMERHHFSREWDDAPMPHSIFFTQRGHAIHGTTHLKAIGQPASHGCVRLAPQNAATLFKLVKQEGMANTRVTLTGETPESAPDIVASPPQRSRRDGGDGWSGDPSEPSFYDGRYFYDRRGRRYSGPAYRERPRYYRSDPFWWGWR